MIRRASHVERTALAIASFAMALVGGSLMACNGAASESAVVPDGAFGSMRVSLSSEFEGVVYRLSASFSVTGATDLSFTTGDLSSEDDVLEQPLASGSYQLRIDSFELFAETDQGLVPQQAELVSPAEQAIQIFPDDTTRVTYRFAVATGEVSFGDGALAIDFSVEQAGCQTEPLPISVADADYSPALDAVIVLAGNTNAVSILNPRTLERTDVALPLPGSDISVGPDGLTAAVAHEGFLSVVDLADATLLDTIPTSSPRGDVVLAGNGFAYILPIYDQWVSVHSIDIAARQDVTRDEFGSSYAGTRIVLHPSGTSMYGITVGLSPTDIEHYDISAGPSGAVRGSPYHGDYAMCADIWPSRDGLRLFTACGSVFRTLPGSADDMTYNGSLQGGSRYFSSIAHAPSNGRVYAIARVQESIFDPEPASTRLEVYSYDYLALEAARDIPCFRVPQGEPAALGEYVFPSSVGDAIFVISRAAPEAGLLRDWGIVTLPP